MPEDEAHLLAYPLQQLLEHGVGFSAIGTFVVAILHKRHRGVHRPARMVSSSDRLQTIAFPTSCHVTSPSPSSRSFEPPVASAPCLATVCTALISDSLCHYGMSR